jgi:hypothetical protein
VPGQKRSVSEEQENRRQSHTAEHEQTESLKVGLPAKALMLGDPRLAHPANAVRRAQLLRAGQKALGNRAVQRMLRSKLEIAPGKSKLQKAVDPSTKAVRRSPKPQIRRQPIEEEEGELGTQPLSAPAVSLGARRTERDEAELSSQPEPLASPPQAAVQKRITSGESESVQSKTLNKPVSPLLRKEDAPEKRKSVLQRQARGPTAPAGVHFGPGGFSWQAIAGGRVPGNAPVVVNLAAPPNVVQRNGKKGELAEPTLSVAPKGKITRGTPVTLTVGFKAKGDEKLEVDSWKFTSSHDEYPGEKERKKPTSDAGKTEFKTKWQGPLVLPGQVVMGYSVKPADGDAKKGEKKHTFQLQERKGGVWESTVDKKGEVPYAGRPSPPRIFKHLGLHSQSLSLAAPKPTTITGGPNKGFKWIENLTKGTYESTPKIHPDLLDAGSAFYKFHLQGSLLFIVNGKKKRVPNSEYSDFKIVGKKDSATVEFKVTNWEAFFRKYGILEVQVEGNDKKVTAKDSWWELSANKKDASAKIKDSKLDKVVAALGLSPGEGYMTYTKSVKRWTGYKLAPSAALLHGTRRHEYQGKVHSHRANLLLLMRAIDPQRKLEEMVWTPQKKVNFTGETTRRMNEFKKPNHHLVNEAASKEQEKFVASGGANDMHPVDVDDTGKSLGTTWNITGKAPMGN